MPLWLTPWLLTTMLLSYVSARLVAFFTEFEPSSGSNDTSKFSGVEGGALMFGLERFYQYVSLACILLLLPPIMIAVVSFQKKLDGHREMLESMKSFDVRHAKCAVEDDRLVIEALSASCLQFALTS